MIEILSNIEVNFVSGGWVCDPIYEGQLFWKAVWHSRPQLGICHYGFDYKGGSYRAPKNLVVGIVQGRRNRWAPKKSHGGHAYECVASDASKCEFMEH